MEIITFQQLQLAFQSALDNSSNKKYIIENEVNSILNYINTVPNFKAFQKKVILDSSQKSNSVFKLNVPDLGRNLLNIAFHNILITGRFEVPETFNDTKETLEFKNSITKQAFEFADYYNWLNTLLATPQKNTSKSSLTHKQKLLALHYLGLNTSRYENTKMAKVLSEILELSEDNTRMFLSYLSAGKNEVRTKNNLEKVKQLFDNQGISDISNTIENDIKKL